MKQFYTIGFKSLTRHEEGTFILKRQYDLKSFSKFTHKGFSRILILIKGE